MSPERVSVRQEGEGHSMQIDQKQKRCRNQQWRVWYKESGGWGYQKQSGAYGSNIMDRLYHYTRLVLLHVIKLRSLKSLIFGMYANKSTSSDPPEYIYIYAAQAHHIIQLYCVSSLWKHQNNPAYTKKYQSLHNVEVGHYGRRKKRITS